MLRWTYGTTVPGHRQPADRRLITTLSRGGTGDPAALKALTLIAGTLLGRNGAASGNPHGLHGIAGQVLLTFSTSSQVVALPPESVSGSGLFRAAVNAGDYKLHADPASASYAGCRTVPALLHVTAGATVKVRIICQLKGIRLVGGH